MNSTTNHPGATDAELISAFVRDDDRDAITEIVRRYEKLVWSVCHRTLRNRSDVEDAFQITFMTLTANAAKIRKRKSLSNWLFGVARKTSLNIRKQRASLSLEDSKDSIASEVDDSKLRLLAIKQQNEIDLVDQQLNALPDRHRTPLIMKYFSGLSAQQIADQMNLSVSAVEGRLRRARAQLKLSLCRARFSNDGADDVLSHHSTLLGLAFVNFVSEPARISMTASNCIASSTGVVTSGMTSISYGAKLMICKTICIFSFGALMSVAMLLHPKASDVPDSIALSSIPTQIDSAERIPAVSIHQKIDEPTCCDADCPGSRMIDVAHQHLLAAHCCVFECVGEVASWLHGTEDS